jgi:trimeric autotransporter adhesin
MNNLKTQSAILLLSILCLSTSAHAQLTPSADAYTNSALPTTNYGAATLLYVENASATQTIYIQFNLSSIPSGYTGADVTKATLKLYVNAVTAAGSFNVDYVNGTWAENKITANLAPALGTTIVSSVALTAASKNQYILIDITAAVQAWLNGSQANDGIALVANSPLNASFDSKENTGTSHAAELEIVYAGIAGVTTASGSGLMGGGSSGTLNLSLTNTCSSKQVLQWNGSTWACASAGTGTITGVTAGTDLTGGGTGGTVTLNVDATKVVTGVTAGTDLTGGGTGGVQTLNLDTTKVPQLGTANTFTGNQTVSGNLSATGVVTGSGYQIGSNLFAFGNAAKQNAFLGFAGNTSMTGQDNTASGYSAFKANTTGGANVANGPQALLNNTSGNDNTAIGSGALSSNDIGSYNTAIGSNAGVTADGTKMSGQSNTFVGSFTGPNTGNLGGTTTLGSFAVVQGNNSTALGSNAFVSGSNSTAIGSNSSASTSNVLVLGEINGVNGATASTNVGIGTTAPISTLDVDANVAGNLGPTITLTNLGGGKGAETQMAFNSYAPHTEGAYNPAAAIIAEDAGGWSDNLYLATNTPGNYNNGLHLGITILSTGAVGIATNSPDNALSVNGNADKLGGGSWGTYSDGRLKNLNGTFTSGLSQVLQIHPVRYRYKPDNALGIHDPEEHIGVVAQEVQRVIPEAVTENSKGYLLVNNDPIIWSMVNAIKEQQGEFQQQQAELAKALRQIRQQQSLLRAQTSAMRSLQAEVREARETLRKVKAQVAAAQLTVVAAK